MILSLKVPLLKSLCCLRQQVMCGVRKLGVSVNMLPPELLFRHTHFKGLNLDKNRTCILVIFGDGRIWFSACRLNNLFHHINHYQENIQTKEMLLIQL